VQLLGPGFGHPGWQQTPRTIGLVDGEMHPAAMLQEAHHDHTLARASGGEDSGSGRQSPVPGQYLAGSAGVGKSWLACALGQKACRDNRSVLYQRIPRMFADLAFARVMAATLA
jgi:IstB-like ATP binding protein